jgi:hypothetical protein
MSSRPSNAPASDGWVRSLAGALALIAFAAPATHAAERKGAAPSIADFERLSGSRARSCSGVALPGLAAMGQPAARRCAWSGRLEMLYWPAIPAPDGTCLHPAAIAWHRLGAAMGAAPPPWRTGWTGQARMLAGDGVQQALAVWQGADGGWSAVLWRWSPAAGPDTRAWEAGHWDSVATAAQSISSANPPPASSQLLQAWLASSNGKPRMLEGDTWRWVSDHTCLVMRTAGISQGQLHLPYARDDARQEQRSGMQVQLARRFPAAQWLQPFTMLDPAVPGKRTGAKFIAVWREGATVQGQLWIPLRDAGGIVRARIGTDVPPTNGAGAQELVAQRAALVARELTGLAHAWEARHE